MLLGFLIIATGKPGYHSYHDSSPGFKRRIISYFYVISVYFITMVVPKVTMIPSQGP